MIKEAKTRHTNQWGSPRESLTPSSHLPHWLCLLRDYNLLNVNVDPRLAILPLVLYRIAGKHLLLMGRRSYYHQAGTLLHAYQSSRCLMRRCRQHSWPVYCEPLSAEIKHGLTSSLFMSLPHYPLALVTIQNVSAETTSAYCCSPSLHTRKAAIQLQHDSIALGLKWRDRKLVCAFLRKSNLGGNVCTLDCLTYI